MLALRWSDREPRPDGPSALKIARSIFVNDDGQLTEKDTKTHQQRRVVLDPETDAVLDEHETRARQRLAQAGLDFRTDGYIFSPIPDGSIPLHPGHSVETVRQASKAPWDRYLAEEPASLQR